MILNTQMGGEGVWFWYATYFHQGSRIYADLHLPLQPLIILETSAWMRILGTKCWQYELPSLLHAVELWAALGWIVRFARWPRATKAALHAVAFCITVVGNSYRFDDYHVTTETFVLVGIALLLELQRVKSTRAALGLAILCGFFSGLALMTRLNDGTAMAGSAAFCVLFLAKRKRLTAALLLLAATVVTGALVIWLTGDTLPAWFSNSILRAVATKGGSGNILLSPFILIGRWFEQIYFRLGILASAVFATWGTRWATRRWGLGFWFLVCGRATILLSCIGLCTEDFRKFAINGRLLDTALLMGILAAYVFGLLVLLRLFGFCRNLYPWHPLEVLLLIPLGQWVSSSASSSGDPLMMYYCPVAVLILLLAVLIPSERFPVFVREEVLVWALCLVVFACVNKAWVPYSWQNWVNSPMYTHRTWYRHPVRGPLYMESDLLAFSKNSCEAVDAAGASNTTLLSLPYPYANYFCAVPPWHAYIQTYFDTTQRSVVEQMIRELKQDPPQWIIYQRQMLILAGAEGLYNHGQPLAQRDLDTLIMDKIKSGQWELVKMEPDTSRDGWFLPGDGKYVVRTHP